LLHALLDHDEYRERDDRRDDASHNERRIPAKISTVADEQVDPPDGHRDQHRPHPVHPAGGRASRFVAGNRSPGKRDGHDSNHQRQDEDGAISEVVHQITAEQRIRAGHPTVDRRKNTTADAEHRRGEAFALAEPKAQAGARR
jgi:hypothetical protein